MFIQKLRARIDELSSEIDVQKTVLKKLEKDKSLVQRQLNAALDPVARLPLEISSEIFLQTLDPSPVPEPGACHASMLLLNVCNAWTTIARSTPSLWTTIRIDFPCATDSLVYALPLWFERTRNRPVSLFLHGNLSPATFDADVSDIIWEHGGQLKHLEIFDDFEDGDWEVINIIGDTTPGSLPLLETLTVGISDSDRGFHGDEILDLLLLAPKIVNCSFYVGIKTWNTSRDIETVVSVPTLRRLAFGDHEESCDADSEFKMLDCLSLPALESLAMTDVVFDSHGLSLISSFLKRVSPPLQELILDFDSRDPRPVVTATQLHHCLRLIPTLSRFKLRAPTVQLVTVLFAALDSSPSLLPNLCDFTIQLLPRWLYQMPIPFISDFSWRTLLRVLSMRRIPLEIKPVASPPEDVLGALRELATGGLQIYIGHDERNFIDSPSEKECDEGSQEESDKSQEESDESQEESVEESE
ncbi:hypothetical protein B0H14DRAFT_3124970 [Mycena olivaceomarginata]|nr:hypothetical protein B0H14DRAFT_3124970 [Mycena olivaceomarginata]